MADHNDDRVEIHYEGNAFARLMGYLKPYWKTVLVCFILVLFLTIFELVRPQIISNAIDRYIQGTPASSNTEITVQESAGNTLFDAIDSRITQGGALEMGPDQRWNGLLIAAGLYIVILIFQLLCSRRQYLMIQELGQKIVYTLRMDLLKHVESLSMRFFDLTPVGKIVTRITNDTEAINDLYANTLVRLFRNVVKIIGLVVVMLLANVRMALLSFIMVPIILVMTIVFRKLSRITYQIVKTRITTLNTFLSEHISGMKVIQIFAREKEKCAEFEEKNESLYRAGLREMLIFGIFRPTIVFLSTVATAIILWGGGDLVIQNVISIGTLFLFTQYISQFFQPLQELAEQFSTLQSAIASAEKIFSLLDVKPQIAEKPDAKVLPQVKGKIEFDHVWFAYDGEHYVLRDVSFVIEPGQKVAFVGATGAGKSSILNLIGRYYDIQKGRILVDDVDIRDLTRDQLRAAIGQVQQDVFIFTGDIKSNIRLRDEEITDEAVREAADHTNAARFIERLPDAYNEHVTERGATFSAGQRQLLSFARTLAHDPTILILDEATANIDTETEQWIQEALEHLMQGRTAIMVAHRLSTIQHADRIIVMHHGKIRESGTHQELLEMNGIYKKLYELQLA